MDPYSQLTNSIESLKANLKKDILAAGYFTGIILLIIGLVLLIIELYKFYKVWSINNWPVKKDSGTVYQSYLETSTSTTTYGGIVGSEAYTSLIYRTRVSFMYQVNGMEYISTKVSYYEPWDSNPMVPKLEYDKFKPGTKVDIRINPNNSNEAYIYNKPYRKYTTTAISIILIYIGAYIAIHSIKKRPKK